MTAIAQPPVSPVDQSIQLTIPFTNHAEPKAIANKTEQLSALVLHLQTDTHAHIQAHLSRYQLQSATCEEREKVTVTASKLAATIVHAIEEEKLTWTLISDTNTDKQTVAINYDRLTALLEEQQLAFAELTESPFHWLMQSLSTQTSIHHSPSTHSTKTDNTPEYRLTYHIPHHNIYDRAKGVAA